MIKVCEIFKSIQGESTYAGEICSFVRLSGCNLSCTYCDTTYASSEQGTDLTIEQIYNRVKEHGTNLVEITGGEPLLQKNTAVLCKLFLDNKYIVLVETNGSLEIDILPPGCVRIVDVKCPGSGEGNSFLLSNLQKLVPRDEVKFVISDRSDFLWSVNFIKKQDLRAKAKILFSPCIGKVAPADLAQWICEENAPVRLSLQIHKFIWGEKRGV